ncbi:flexible cuticle protein 12-like [Contarinia nasturtii]|uniref:flexible cuticle protein 12-like n=1 Tax=Contarinia nasturtii TaxID=265458 RepID=UPI0012D419FA|nr:flexible cuticle protein 12-like [Contarinia nasturtii]XP_031637837.1 flexible cuticle protein 12-like [Contarinia nasturtii]
MKFAIVMFALIAVGSAAILPGGDASAETLRNDATVGIDSFQYAYETSNGIKAEEQGQLKTIGTEQAIVTQGLYSWISPDGQTFTLKFVADENGYQPVADHLPVAPASSK